MNKRNLMIKAHKIAKSIVAIVGDYMVAMKIALKQAWGEKMNISISQFSGSIAQKEYARDIIEGGISYCNDVIERYEAKDQSKPKVARVLAKEKARLARIMDLVNGGKKINSKMIIESSKKVELAHNKQFVIDL